MLFFSAPLGDAHHRARNALVVRCPVRYPAGDLRNLLVGKFAPQRHTAVLRALADTLGVSEDIFAYGKIGRVPVGVATPHRAVSDNDFFNIFFETDAGRYLGRGGGNTSGGVLCPDVIFTGK